MEFLTELNFLLIQDLGLTQELANITCGVVVGISLFVVAILYFYLVIALGNLLGYIFFKHRYYLINIENGVFLIEKHFYFFKRRIKSIEKKYGQVVLIKRFDSIELLYIYMLQNEFDIENCYLGKDYKTVLDKMDLLYGVNENEKEQ